MLAHHIVVQHKLNKHCVQRLVSSTRFSKLLFSVLSTPRLSFLSFYVLLCTYSSSSVLTSPFLSLLVLLCPYLSFSVLTSPLVSQLVLFRPYSSFYVLLCSLLATRMHTECFNNHWEERTPILNCGSFLFRKYIRNLVEAYLSIFKSM